MLSWHEDFIAKICANVPGEYYIIRYDIRDTGRSTHFALLPEDKRGYFLTDLCGDAIALLDHLQVKSANFVGFSIGGGISWTIAARHPERVRSITLISSSPVGPNPSQEDQLPFLDAELLGKIQAAPQPNDWHDKDEAIKFLTYFDSCMASEPLLPSEASDGIRRAGMAFDRAEMAGGAVNSFFNQQGAAWTRWSREELRKVKCPTVVIHGRKDRNVPLPHGETLQKEIAGAKLVVIDDIGHELPRRCWDEVVENIVSIAV